MHSWGIHPTPQQQTQSRWDDRFLALAHHISQWSKDPGTKVGAVLVGLDKRQVALGYNGFPPLINDSPERLADRTQKLQFTIHAERNVLDNAHFSAQGGTLYTTHPPCCACSLSIISKGIHRVVSSPILPEFARRWGESVDQSRLILREANIAINF